jgi:hypothetical protein
MGPFFVWALIKALFVKIVVFKTKLFKVDWSGSARLLWKASLWRENQPQLTTW